MYAQQTTCHYRIQQIQVCVCVCVCVHVRACVCVCVCVCCIGTIMLLLTCGNTKLQSIDNKRFIHNFNEAKLNT